MRTRRVDELLIEQGLAGDIHTAQSLVMAGRVLAGINRVSKPSDKVAQNVKLSVKGELDAYVSRGAHKLKKALEVFPVDVAGRTCIDVGASTGGFTDVMLRAGAKRVYAVDVGYNQLHYKLRVHEKVVCMERTNARFLTPDMFEEAPVFGATDVSFISLKAVLPSVFSIMAENAQFVALIKPQFEAEKEQVGEKGVVRDKNVHLAVIADVIDFVETKTDWTVKGLDFSPIRGPEGNIEFLLYMCGACAEKTAFDRSEIERVVAAAYDKFIKS